MQTQIKKWGNSLALRIPAYLLKELNIKENSLVDIFQEEDKLVILPIHRKNRYSLELLLEGVTEKNKHNEIDTGPSIGEESW